MTFSFVSSTQRGVRRATASFARRVQQTEMNEPHVRQFSTSAKEWVQEDTHGKLSVPTILEPSISSMDEAKEVFQTLKIGGLDLL
mmetsp:Transcript_9034/g.10800  ORF Transcript_9034/g.10800 Transcript_9034/m.10800 type:complete len:85 (-) Transcript_9034:283-537(-)|eukprot:CAMPEP_0195253354 /NCGR_PEP_ID=MMETSP0706-20130129/4410_1 /TAXON_ID=33640 /ORGANISM="Asterionellopsis glacialis, Strain CCMP134" /LENGTH=84 /DNA_ID=CAMNT_0040305829 /DNA_START=89 /DNA_END=343 /DNA_ORIENTATION=+